MADKSTYSPKTIFDKVADKVWEQIVNQTISANDRNIQFETNDKTKKLSETEIKSPEIEKSVKNILIEKDIEHKTEITCEKCEQSFQTKTKLKNQIYDVHV